MCKNIWIHPSSPSHYPLLHLTFLSFFRRRIPVKSLDVNSILDLLEQDDTVAVDGIYVNPPEGDDSDGYDDSDTEEGQSAALSRNILKVNFYIYFGRHVTCVRFCSKKLIEKF